MECKNTKKIERELEAHKRLLHKHDILALEQGKELVKLRRLVQTLANHVDLKI